METPLITQITGFTLSPKPQKCDLTDGLLKNWIVKIHKALKRFAKTYTVYPEIDPSGRLHFHGWFIKYDTIKFYKCNGTLRSYGHVKYEMSITDKWIKYCAKDEEGVKLLFNPSLVPFNEKTLNTLIQDEKEKYLKSLKKGWFCCC